MITAIEPKVALDGRYSIAETAKALGVHRNSVMNYTNQGLLHCRFRKATSKKFYLGSEILRFWRIMM